MDKNSGKMISEAYHGDCMDYMSQFPDKFFDLAVVDPPYGNSIMKKNKYQRFASNDTSYRNKSTPNQAYYDELFRVSKKQIIWGAQYQIEYLPGGGSLIVCDKGADPDKHNMSACDIAWYSQKARIRKASFHWCGAVKCEREPTIHIHQKPVALYRWVLKYYAHLGDKIFDSHMGSQSSRIAAHDMGFDFWGSELDEEYFKSGCERYRKHIAQLTLEFQ